MFIIFDDVANALSAQTKNPFVDPLANMAYVGEINALDDWNKQVKIFHNPKFLRYFLHESTHHSSFIGPVGGAFSKLALSCFTFFPKVIDGQNKYNLVTRDILIYNYAWHLFQPLFEGLALFQEYDSYTGSTSTCTTNTSLWLKNAAPHLAKEPISVEFLIRRLIDKNILYTDIEYHIKELRISSSDRDWEFSKELVLKPASK